MRSSTSKIIEEAPSEQRISALTNSPNAKWLPSTRSPCWELNQHHHDHPCFALVALDVKPGLRKWKMATTGSMNLMIGDTPQIPMGKTTTCYHPQMYGNPQLPQHQWVDRQILDHCLISSSAYSRCYSGTLWGTRTPREWQNWLLFLKHTGWTGTFAKTSLNGYNSRTTRCVIILMTFLEILEN